VENYSNIVYVLAIPVFHTPGTAKSALSALAEASKPLAGRPVGNAPQGL
jgi:acyl-CoA synthetase (NDP forming)